jgi:hypothetical protein
MSTKRRSAITMPIVVIIRRTITRRTTFRSTITKRITAGNKRIEGIISVWIGRRTHEI